MDPLIDSDNNQSENEDTVQAEIPDMQPGPSTATHTPAVVPKLRRSSSEPTLTESHPKMKSVSTKRNPYNPRTTEQTVYNLRPRQATRNVSFGSNSYRELSDDDLEPLEGELLSGSRESKLTKLTDIMKKATNPVNKLASPEKSTISSRAKKTKPFFSKKKRDQDDMSSLSEISNDDVQIYSQKVFQWGEHIANFVFSSQIPYKAFDYDIQQKYPNTMHYCHSKLPISLPTLLPYYDNCENTWIYSLITSSNFQPIPSYSTIRSCLLALIDHMNSNSVARLIFYLDDDTLPGWNPYNLIEVITEVFRNSGKCVKIYC